uniref:Uncharacterized protein LOC104242726 n=1 Tax=Nicotiana sylvestris TaxID=4096 RepID=A0A1U7Y2D8_NICSY|nr:PREDICTED: uncharacterized protein LOC104242726 [Nicotiana sylvestris]
MDKQSVEELCELSGYKKGTLSFRYLGVPILAKKISAVDYEILVDKMCARIQSWRIRNLLYAGRVLLENSVLMYIHSFWSSIFILPKKILRNITAICRNFLLDGKANSNKVPLVAWDLVCKPKQEGGLGIIDCDLWNQAAIAKGICPAGVVISSEAVHNQQWLHLKTRNKRKWESSRWVWSKYNTLKHSFISWLAMHRRLLTRERLASWESAKTITVSYVGWEVNGIWRRMTRRVRGKECRRLITAILVALVYRIWRVRNDALWNQKVAKPHMAVKEIKEECRNS